MIRFVIVAHLRIANAGDHGAPGVHALGTIIGVAEVLLHVSWRVVVAVGRVIDSLLLRRNRGHRASEALARLQNNF